MKRIQFFQFRSIFAIIILSSFLISCSTKATSQYWGETKAPTDNVMRYVTGSEPESLDPQFVTGQPEARIMMAIYDGLVEYHPKTMEPIPAIAESWELGEDGTEYVFHLRKNAKFSNGDPITAKDFVYSFRRALSPELASRNANLAYYIKYSEAYNSGRNFVQDEKGQFLLKKDFSEEAEKTAENTAPTENKTAPTETKPAPTEPESEFHKFIDAPERLTVDGDSFTLAKALQGDDKLRPYFNFKIKDLKDATGFVNKIKSGTDELSKYLASKLNQNALNACANAASCNDAAKQSLLDSLNKLMLDEAVYTPERFAGLTLSKESEGVIKKFDAANKKIEEDNAALDKEIAELKTDEEKQAKAKKKKEKIAKLFYVNRVLLEDVYKDYLGKVSLVPVTAENIGVEAIDDYTLRIKLYQPAPFFLGLLAHQFFRVVHQGTIEKFGKDWMKPANIVTSGPFKVKSHHPYDELTVVRDPNYWDAANVKLDGIEYYPMDEQTTMMNLYKAGRVDALYNHTVPAPWNEVIRQYKDEYLLHPEVAVEYYSLSVKKPPMDNLKVRQAFALAIDRDALAQYRKTVKPLVDFTPEGIFPKYEEARTKVYTEELKKQGSSLEEWKARKFDAAKARKLLTEAGYPVEGSDGNYSCPTFPVAKVTLTYNTAESNKAVAEFVQAQWKQNLGIEIPLKNMEWKTFLPFRSAVEYQGAVRNGWVGDYMDPFTFLNLFYSQQNDGATGWYDPKYDKMLDEANKETDEMKRFELMARAEFYVMQQQIVIPLSTNGTSWMKKPYIKGMYPNAGTLHPWKFVYIEKDVNKWDSNVDNIMKESDAAVDNQIKQLTATQDAYEQKKKAQKEETKTAKAE